MKTPAIPAETPFRTKLRPRWLPREMVVAPLLDPSIKGGPVAPRTALLIKHDFVHTVWHPLVEWTRRRHLKFRARLAVASGHEAGDILPHGSIVSAGVEGRATFLSQPHD